MRSVQVSKPKGPFEIVDRDIPEPGDRHVRIKVQACGVCHSDSFTKEGLFPGIQYPRVPGHEIAGVIDVVGKNVTEWKFFDLDGGATHSSSRACYQSSPDH
jgi:D-arabinose 1-dehydrogenase-like Zn-dependent alcohol dehydrogenase